MKLELKHLSAYLPYEAKARVTLDDQSELPYYMSEDGIYTLDGMMIDWYLQEVKEIKLILRPLSDLTKEIEHNGEKFVPLDKIYGDRIPSLSPLEIEDIVKRPLLCIYPVVQKLHEWHFDTFGLIESGNAIDYNELNK